MASPAKRPYPKDHPVLLDEELRERLLDIMWRRIQKTISKTQPAKRRSASTADLTLAGAIRAEEVLNEALAGVLYKEPSTLTGTWEGFATEVAHNKAVDAVRRNTKGRIRAGAEIDLASIDREDPHGDTLGDELADPLADPEREAIELAQERVIQRLAGELLSERDRDIFYRVHYLGQTRAEVGRLHGLTGPGVGHVYAEAAKKIHKAARQDPDFPTTQRP